MSERDVKKPKNPWAGVLSDMQRFAERHGMICEERNWKSPEYQICQLRAEGVRLIVYPHTTGTSGQHARIRNENSKDRDRADELMGDTGLWIKHRGAWTGKAT